MTATGHTDGRHTDDQQGWCASRRSEQDGARFELRPIGVGRGTMITVLCGIGHDDAAVLSRRLHAAFDADLKVVVVDLSGVPRCVTTGVRVLTAAREHAHTADIDLHLVHLSNPDARAWLTAAGLA